MRWPFGERPSYPPSGFLLARMPTNTSNDLVDEFDVRRRIQRAANACSRGHRGCQSSQLTFKQTIFNQSCCATFSRTYHGLCRPFYSPLTRLLVRRDRVFSPLLSSRVAVASGPH